MKYRKCFVLKEIEIDMGILKKGDVFRLGKASAIDNVNVSQWSSVTKDAEKCEPKGNFIVEASPITFVKCMLPSEISFKEGEE